MIGKWLVVTANRVETTMNNFNIERILDLFSSWDTRYNDMTVNIKYSAVIVLGGSNNLLTPKIGS